MVGLAPYQMEIDDGVAPLLSECRASYASVARPAAPSSVPDAVRAFARERARADERDDDLYYLDTVLVSTSWNNNDDVFDPLEVWAARHTPSHKPFNYEHDAADVIGHMLSSVAVDNQGKPVSEDSAIDALPDYYHLVTGAVLYRHWGDNAERQERMDNILAGVAAGDWFVSMECLFKGFDYALKGADGSCKIVARNKQTAFLTKHLRAYGGSGTYGDYRLGRLVRNILFSGKGLVKKPANPASVILQPSEPFPSAKASFLSDFPPRAAGPVYLDVTKPQETASVNENEILTKQLAEARAELERVKASQTEAATAELKARLEAALKSEADAKALVTKASDELKAATAALALRDEALESKAAELAAAVEEIGVLHAEKAIKARTEAAVKAGLGEADAAEYAETNKLLGDEAYARNLEFLAKALAMTTSNNPQPGNTGFPGPAAQKRPQATDKPLGPQSTDKPAPAKGSESEEVDKAGEEAAAAAELEKAEASAEAALQTGEVPAGVLALQAQIADYLKR